MLISKLYLKIYIYTFFQASRLFAWIGEHWNTGIWFWQLSINTYMILLYGNISKHVGKICFSLNLCKSDVVLPSPVSQYIQPAGRVQALPLAGVLILGCWVVLQSQDGCKITTFIVSNIIIPTLDMHWIIKKNSNKILLVNLSIMFFFGIDYTQTSHQWSFVHTLDNKF